MPCRTCAFATRSVGSVIEVHDLRERRHGKLLVNGSGGIVVLGIAIGFAARFRLWIAPRVARSRAQPA